MTRAATNTIVGALAVAVGWTIWSTLGPREPSESAPPAGTAVAEVAPPPAAPTPAPPAAPPRPAEQASGPSVVAAAPVQAAPPLRDGLVVEHGMPTAVHALAGDPDVQALPPPAAGLPPGARPEDAVVNRAGTIALNRSAATPPGIDAATANAARQPAATHAP